MSARLRVIVASYGAVQFRLLHDVLTNAGHIPVAYVVSRSMRPDSAPETDILNALTGIIADLPPGMDLLLPGNPAAMTDMLAGYAADILLVFGFNWLLPQDVLALPRLGTLNVHPSALPKYRGPSPVLWAIRNGDHFLGMTVHWMNSQIDAGPVLAQVTDLPLPDLVTRESAWDLQAAALPAVLGTALERAAHGDPGVPQEDTAATYAGFPPSDWFTVTWEKPRLDVRNQIRVLRFLRRTGPTVQVAGREVRVEDSSLTDNGGIRVECADGPLWLMPSPVS